MEHDSESNCDGRLRDFEVSEDPPRLREIPKDESSNCTANSAPWYSLGAVAPKTVSKLGTTNRSLSSQVMEYYHKYSQNANLDQYFSLPITSASSEAIKCYYNIYEASTKLEANRQDCVGEEYGSRSYVPRERRRWVRPPLIGQSSNSETSPRYIRSMSNAEPESPTSDLKGVTPDTILEEKNESQEMLTEATERKVSSPTSSIASHKPLEWDSGADVGYFNISRNSKQNDKKLSTIERMALARGCSAALRLDPEGTTESGISGQLAATQKSSNTVNPAANSTPLPENASGSENEIEITPIMKNHLPGIITGNGIKSNERPLPKDLKRQDNFLQYSQKEHIYETPKSAATTLVAKIHFAKQTPEVRKVSSRQNTYKEICSPTSPLKKSTSMNTLAVPTSKLTLKRSQSELNLHGRDRGKAALPLIFNSSSSIATIVNKPSTCDKVIQTSLYACSQESVGVQVSVLEDEKPPLPKRGASLQKSLATIAKNSKDMYKTQNPRRQDVDDPGNVLEGGHGKEGERRNSYTELSQNGSGTRTPQPAGDGGNITGRANSFEYFPGHIYENVPNGGGSQVSSSETARSHSTLPNTSSSINEKLWGDSDSLVKDLERSVNILKSLVDANKCDKEVKKRLIHHVVKRLITAKYTDDRIEHNLEDNIPWNPDDARSKVYEREILEALTKKRNVSDSSGDWNTRKEMAQGRSSRNIRGIIKGMALESSSDKNTIDKNTDRTETDGRKARMGLRSDDCPRSSNATTDPDKSESSECFFPQRGRKGNKVQDIFCAKERCKVPQGDSTTTNSTPPDHNRMLLDAVVNSRRAAVRSCEEQADWRLLTTFSERQFELKKSGNSDSGDSKLVSYAEMEKRNQLIWITNEISHLCNLKKLLEESRRPERPRASPKKSRSGNLKMKTMGSLAHLQESAKEEEYLPRDGMRSRANSVEDPWSSHCNLAACQLSSRSSSIIQRIKKRNSCAQTATNVTGAHSKTGGEIVSATNMQNSTMKLVSTGVQTVPQETSTIPALIQSEIVHYVKCSAHNTVQFKNSYKCNEQVNQCLKHQPVQNVVTTCMQCLQEQRDRSSRIQKVCGNVEKFREESPVGTQTPSDLEMNGNSIISSEVGHRCANKEVQTSPFGQKDAKNQINASKSKICDCKCDNRRTIPKGCQRCSAQGTSMEGGTASKCEEWQRKMFHARDRGDENSKESSCTIVCECDNEKPRKGGRAPMKHSSKYYQNSNGHASSSNQNGCGKLCECSNDCSCENNYEPEAQNAKGYCSYHSKPKSQHNEVRYYGHFVEAADRSTQPWPYCATNGQASETLQYKIQCSSKCDCENDCYCNSRGKTSEEMLHGRTCNSGKPNYVDEANQTCDSDTSCKYCRRCGAAYQNVRKCSCYQTYPKAIAYELSFSRGTTRKADNLDALQKVPLSNRTVNEGKPDGCACDMIKKVGAKKSSPQKSSLQDYLSKNKSEFVNNAETRRRYMSEISQLRQLRKQKRIQLLAMASTSNIAKSSKASKATAYTQRKVSDEEMREKLRKRYRGLNEVRQKRRQQEQQEEARRNKLMAKIFCKKLQQKVLRGQVDLSQSVSVISNM